MSLLALLSEPIARAVRLAFVPADTRALLAHLKARVIVRARIEDPLPPAAAQLLKATTLGGALIGEIQSGPTSIELVHGERRRVLTEAELSTSIGEVLRTVLPELLSPEALVTALESFSAHAAKLATLRDLTALMLRAEDVDVAVHTMLTGISSGQGLGFHRVALFQFDEERGAFVGTRAIGPADEREAHRIWEAIEYDDKGLDGIVSDYQKRNVDARFEQEVRGIALVRGAAEGDEVARALDHPGPQRFGPHLVNASVAALSPAREFVMASIRPHGKVRGLLFCDHKYGQATLDDERVAMLGGFLDSMALVWENLILLRRVEQLARYDALTGVFTRRAFEERLAEEQARATRTDTALSLLLVDVDRFKEINDTQGHAAGDAVLRALGAVLRRDVRGHDVVGRVGGDEFVVLLPAASAEECAIVARRIGAAAHAQNISLSIGAACWPDDCSAPERLIATADERLYEAKRAGRGRVSFGGSRSSQFP